MKNMLRLLGLLPSSPSFIPALIAGGAAIAGGLLQQNSSARQAADQRQSEWRATHEQMAFQERMSGTAHQREIVDLRAAGLNPILSGTGGAGSTTPGGAKGSFGMQPPPANIGQDAVNAAMAARRNKVEVENIEADTHKKGKEAALTHSLNNLSSVDYRFRQEQEATQKALTAGAESQASILANSAKGAQVEGDIDSTTYGKLMRYIDRSLDTINTGTSAIGARRRR